MVEEKPEVETYAVAQKVDTPPGSAAITYGVSIPAGNATTSSSDVPMWQQKKVGAKCCGCCCDYRRAVIIVEIISIVFAIISIINLMTFSSIGFTGPVQDDHVEDIIEQSVTASAVLIVISLLTSICGLFGALKFSIWLVAVDLVWRVGKYSSHWNHDSDSILLPGAECSCVSIMMLTSTLCGLLHIVNYICGIIISMRQANQFESLLDDQVTTFDYKYVLTLWIL